MPQVARGMNAARKLVASRTIRPTWRNAERIEGDLVEAVRALKAQEGRGITVLGSGSVVRRKRRLDVRDQRCVTCANGPKRARGTIRRR